MRRLKYYTGTGVLDFSRTRFDNVRRDRALSDLTGFFAMTMLICPEQTDSS